MERVGTENARGSLKNTGYVRCVWERRERDTERERQCGGRHVHKERQRVLKRERHAHKERVLRRERERHVHKKR